MAYVLLVEFSPLYHRINDTVLQLRYVKRRNMFISFHVPKINITERYATLSLDTS